MTPEITKLPSGHTIVSVDMPHVETVSLGVYVDVGARHESKAQNGISHLIEHMAFKGTAKRSAQAIAEEIEDVGGEINAATGVESTAYYSKVLKADVTLALDIITDIVANPAYDETELEKEREVILQEIAATRDSPEEIAFDLLSETAYPDQALGRPILGSAKSVKAQSPADLRKFLAEMYAPKGIVLSAAGRITHADLVKAATPLLEKVGHAKKSASSEKATYKGGAASSKQPFEQCHLLIGLEGPTYKTKDIYAAQVMSGLFGGGMSSRLFQEVREKRGLCYSIYSGISAMADTGMMTIHAATGVDQLEELTRVIHDELKKLADTAPSAREVERSKAQMRAGLLMALESSGARSEQMARQMRVWGKLVPAAELVARVDAVTPNTVRKLAAEILSKGNPTAVVVGAGGKSARFAEQAAALLQAT